MSRRSPRSFTNSRIGSGSPVDGSRRRGSAAAAAIASRLTAGASSPSSAIAGKPSCKRSPKRPDCVMRDWSAVLRERLAAEGLVPSAHVEAIDEIADHLADLHRGAMGRGDTEAEADAVVQAEFDRMGSLATAVERRARRQTATRRSNGHWTSGLAYDLRHAVRILSLERGFSAIVIVTVAIGIGGCAAVFSLINALVLRPLPYPDPARLVMVWE